ncbi:hypothetical protein H5410_028741 [Solanum commersonii]|uniref:Uncharacterized protein n=1 Tax=Solanum commersonii TaxID=4109 RepID=A0A9J5Z2Z8_SOLCO|nr:hypothetical protein H5410_028741 [Solanum commersonii]
MENGDSNFSNTDDALIFGSADISVGNASMISGPNMSSSFMSVEYHHRQQSMSLSAGDIDGDGDLNKETSKMLIQISIACFEVIQQKNLNLADALLTDLRNFRDSEIGELKNVATDFAQALAQMINQTPKPISLNFILRKVLPKFPMVPSGPLVTVGIGLDRTGTGSLRIIYVPYREMSINTTTEEDSDSFDSNTDAIIYGVYDDSGSGESLISDPNILSSSSSSEDDDFLQQQQLRSTAAAVRSVGTDDLTVPTSASFSWYTNNNNKEMHEPKAIMIFNVDFRALSSGVNNEIEGLNLKFCGKRVREEENEVFLMNKEMRREQMVYPLTLTPSYGSAIWECNGKGIFDVPPLSPLTTSKF